MALPANASQINTSDTIADTIKTTAGYFTNGDGTIEGTSIFTHSLADSNEKYYFNVCQTHPLTSSAEVQFSVTYGHFAGSGSNTYGDSNSNPNTLRGETQAVYNQLSQLLMEESEVSGGFKISAGGSSGVHSAGTKDEYVYALIGKRSKFKDRINKKAWTLVLDGIKTDNSEAFALHLTDDSSTIAPVATPGGPRYNIVSGTLGTVADSKTASVRTYGWFYPEMGIMLFSGAELSASIPGMPISDASQSIFQVDTTRAATTAAYVRSSSLGFAPCNGATANKFNALKLAMCMRYVGSSTTLRLRSEEDQTQENYFCRIKAPEYNFSSNPTFTSGSKNKIRNADMHGNPQTFITGVGLYNSAGQLLAIAKLSSPLKKNFASEATIKVKLTY
tara:strand:+ start:1922 stop:3091 length:1170 start_codon:yes stop_codon:yes gene_type:complete